VNTGKIKDNEYEVGLHLEAKCTSEDQTVYIAELTYAAVFRIENMPADSMQPLMLIECPRLIFPFARQILGDAVRDGGFPPLYLDPIDFAGLYRQRMEQMAAQREAQGTADA
jgi:preprotein translocase subunit SecB